MRLSGRAPLTIMRPMTFPTPRAAAVAAIGLAASAAVLGGCAELSACDTSNDSNPVQLFEEGITDGRFYMSSDWDGPLLSFPGGKRYQLMHHLGCRPANVSFFVSFSENGVGDANVAPSAGNMTIMQEITDEFIVVKNDTCSDMYLLVTAEAGDSCGAGGDTDASPAAPVDGVDAGEAGQ